MQALAKKSLATVLLMALFPPSFSWAGDEPPTVEVARYNDLAFRGQGLAPFCFAFAEEQLMKDATCKGSDCSLDASQWKYSIFDIVRAHREFETREKIQISAANVHDLFDGAKEDLPFLQKPRIFSAAHCTLEKDLFRINRSEILNPSGYEFEEMLPAIFNGYKAAHSLIPTTNEGRQEIEKFQLEGTLTILEQLAQTSSDGLDFMSRAINYRSCTDKAQTPNRRIQKVLATERASIEAAIAKGLSRRRSVLVSLCAFNLRDEKDSDDCGGHAVVLKEQKGNDFLVVDSAFFSNRPRQADGSIYIPKEVVIEAILRKFKNNPFAVKAVGAKEPDDRTMLYFDLIMASGNSLISNFIVDYWHQSELMKRKAAGSFIRQVVEPTLAMSKLSKAEAMEWRGRFANINLNSDDGLNTARSTVAAFMDKMDSNSLFAFAKILAHGHWLDQLADHADLSKLSENITWFE